MYIRTVIQMDIIKVKFTFLVTFAEGRENVIGNGHMKTLRVCCGLFLTLVVDL